MITLVVIVVGLSFSIAALVLAAIGIYGVLARNIALSTKDIGVRRALGSPDFNVIVKYIRQGLYFLSIGTVIGGGAACLAIVALVSSYPIDNVVNSLPLLCLLVAGVMAAVIFLASYIPARKAVSLEPGDALRYE